MTLTHGLRHAGDGLRCGWRMATRRKDPGPQDLCAACGFCCNGVIFANVKLQPGDDASRLLELSLPLKAASAGGTMRFCQPCAAHDGCRCSVYPDRPTYCRQFDCLLLQSVKAGSLEPHTALRVIRRAKKQVTEIRQLLGELGDSQEQKPLRARFREVCRRLEGSDCGAGEAQVFGRLSLAMHNLNLLLAERFYSG
jgi:uncharacterized protein